MSRLGWKVSARSGNTNDQQSRMATAGVFQLSCYLLAVYHSQVIY